MINTSIKISILVPIYGVEKYIERCAVSLFEQTYENIEFIFVNDCTKDNSVEVLKQVVERYPNRHFQIKIVNHTKNRGLAAARLTGLQVSTGDYIWFVDSDDWIANNAMEYITPHLQEGYDAIWFDFFQVTESSQIRFHRKEPVLKRVISQNVPACIWATVYKKSLFYENEIFPVEGINHSEDFVLNSRLMSVIRNGMFIDKGLYFYECANSGSYMHNISLSSVLQGVEGMKIVYNYYDHCLGLKKYKKYLLHYWVYYYLKIYYENPHLSVLNEISAYIERTSHLVARLLIKYRDREPVMNKMKRILYLFCKYY